jgi:glycosyltransferase involved in cell wall biosynthesis
MSMNFSNNLRNNSDDISLSILVLTYNHEKFIQQCLLSIKSIVFPSWHIWVLDDGSTDQTPEIVRRFAAENTGITLVTQKNSGGSTSRNLQRLLDVSWGRYVMFMSGDDMLGPGFPVQSFYDRFQQHPNIGLILPRVVVLDSNPTKRTEAIYTQDMIKLFNSGDPNCVFDKYLNKRVSSIFIQGMMIERNLLERIGGFDIDLTADDYALVCKLFSNMPALEKKFYFFQEAFWIYRIHDSNIHKNALRQIKIITEVVGRYIKKKNWALFDWHIMPLKEAKDIFEAEFIFLSNIDEEISKKILKKIITKTYACWIESGDFIEIKKSILGMQASTLGRWCAIYCLIKSLPVALIGLVLRVPIVSNALRVLSLAAQRRI